MLKVKNLTHLSQKSLKKGGNFDHGCKKNRALLDFFCNLVTVDQLMWSTIVHHIPRWREPSPLRDFMRRLWTYTLWNVDCLHANWLIRCIWIAVSAVFMEKNAHSVCFVDDKVPLGCGGRQTRVARVMWWTIIWDVGDDICPWIYLII